MCKTIRVILSLMAGLVLIGLLGGRYSGGVVDKFDVDTYDKASVIDKADQIDLPEVAKTYSPYVSYTRTVRTSASTGYGSYKVMGDYIAVAGRNVSVVEVGSTTVDAGDHVNKYGSRFYYGHNTGAVFGGLYGLGVGSNFSIYNGGVLHNYRVSKVVIFEKNTANGRLELNGSGNYMKSVAEARSGGVQYDVSLMTCYGTSYGNGDASHRLVIFANEF